MAPASAASSSVDLLPTVFAIAASSAAILILGHWRADRARYVADALETCGPCEEEAAAEDVPAAAAAASSPRQLPKQKEQQVRTPRAALLEISPRLEYGLSKDPDSTVAREGYINWNDYFMSVAMLSAFRSKDPNRQVGACIVDPRTSRIVGIGYNGFPWGCSDDALPWAREADSWMDTKNPYVCHAEMNAIMNKNSASLEGCRIYTTLFPCNDCAKLIIQSRMTEVVYLSEGQINKPPFASSRRLLTLAGIGLSQHKPKVPRVVVDFQDPLAM